MLNFDESKKLYYISQSSVNCVYQFLVSVRINTVQSQRNFHVFTNPTQSNRHSITTYDTNCPEIC